MTHRAATKNQEEQEVENPGLRSRMTHRAATKNQEEQEVECDSRSDPGVDPATRTGETGNSKEESRNEYQQSSNDKRYRQKIFVLESYVLRLITAKFAFNVNYYTSLARIENQMTYNTSCEHGKVFNLTTASSTGKVRSHSNGTT